MFSTESDYKYVLIDGDPQTRSRQEVMRATTRLP
jgi:hypothetical protein